MCWLYIMQKKDIYCNGKLSICKYSFFILDDGGYGITNLSVINESYFYCIIINFKLKPRLIWYFNTTMRIIYSLKKTLRTNDKSVIYVLGISIENTKVFHSGNACNKMVVYVGILSWSWQLEKNETERNEIIWTHKAHGTRLTRLATKGYSN